ncbi:TMV resistance protein N-like isoform X1 [Juglans microcarpa x Juglans regia]|uniref:TMV resistance protein N-like isoform X1 n=1 Tax=Juglans microcarpa x Juglans regia TaxID=2249226 RepID=UPI001B7F6991|nr:TMV resistance protein N-like isoform X1 [Juglans microcarpa x Juglans regia]
MAFTSNIQTTPSSSSSCSKHQWKYEVFLSFRGETRETFTSHLCNELREKLIYTFMDDVRLEIGRPIKKELLDAIEKSRMAVIIVSKEYASSTWCLEELAKIVECMKDRELKVLPIFYHVNPSDARKQEDGTFRDAFAKHEKNLENKEKVQTWRNALKEVANLSGYHLKNEDESKFIKKIVERISIELSNTRPSGDENNLVGVDTRVKEMYLDYFDIGSNDVRFIGIWGMSGMGKTTLARVIFLKYNHLFRARSFLENVSLVSKRNGIVALQENLLSDMKLKDDQEKWDVLKGIDVIRNRLRYTKVLIVLDDVDEKEQLETLAGNCNWFGAGSRIIVTTKDRHLLTRHRVRFIYPIKGLHKREALQLFSQQAFHDPDQREDQDFLDLCNDYVSYADGHPLTLKVLGSSLFGKGREVWRSSLNRLQVLPHRDIVKKLKIGFDALGETEKKVFLDIACFFNGEDKDRVVDLLEGSDCFPNVDIETLVDKSLITILGRKLWMHSLLQRLGWEIVRCEYPKKLGKRSRLWCRDEILEVLRKKYGTYKVEGIMLSTSSPHQEEDLNPEAFSKMNKLRLIKICDVNLPRGLNSLSNGLQLIDWHEYPLRSTPESFQPINLVELIMHRSSFLQLPMAFLNLNKLKVMDFSGSENLLMTPDFSGCPSLQRLIFEGSTRLYEVHPSIGALNQLILLNLKDCKSLSRLPHEINLESLKVLMLSGCSRLSMFPEIGQNMKHLSELYLDGTAIQELPLSIQHLTGLTLLNLGDSKQLLVFPSVISFLPALKTLILSGCKGQPPSSVLFSIGAPLTLSLPSFFSGLTSLVALDLNGCNLLDGALPDNLSSLTSLESLNLSRNNFTRLPQSISQLPKLKFLYLDNCSKLQLLPNLPSTTQFVMARECTSLQNYSNQIVVSTSGGGEFTVINCLSLAASEEDILSEVSLLDRHFHPLWMEEQIHQSEEYHGISQTTIPKWFNQNCWSSISIPLPYDLSKDSSWRGIVLHTVLDTDVQGVTLADASNNSHELICSLDIDGGPATFSVVLPKYQRIHDRSFGLCLYISHARLRNQLDQCNCFTTRFTSNSPSIVISCCGARILYKQDMMQFVQIISQKNFGWRPLISQVQSVADLKPYDEFYAASPLDFHPSTRYSYCFPPSKVQDWFTHQSCGQSVAIDIPPRLYYNDNWMGLVLYASFSIRRDPETLLDNCQLQMGILSFHTSRHAIKRFVTRGGFCWIAYIPGNQLTGRVCDSSHIVASFVSDCPIITMEKCGLRILYKHDQGQFEQELKHCNDLFSEYRDSMGPFMAALEKTNETTVPVHSLKDLKIEISISGIPRQDKSNKTCSRSNLMQDRVYNSCYRPSKILEWFTHRSADSIVTVPLPPNDRTSWIGLALCASLSVPGHSSYVADNFVSPRLPSNLICDLETDIDSVERFHSYCLTEHDLKLLSKLGGFIWLSYIPRRLFPDFMDECSWIDASISTDYPGLMVKKCGFRLLYNEEELNDQFEETKSHFSNTPDDNKDVWGKLYHVDPKNSRDTLISRSLKYCWKFFFYYFLFSFIEKTVGSSFFYILYFIFLFYKKDRRKFICNFFMKIFR